GLLPDLQSVRIAGDIVRVPGALPGIMPLSGQLTATAQRLPKSESIKGVTSRPLWIISLLAACALGAAYSDYDSVKRKLDSIESDQVRPGSRVELSPRELNAYAEHEAPAGVRNPRIQLVSREVANGTALVDFGKLQR